MYAEIMVFLNLTLQQIAGIVLALVVIVVFYLKHVFSYWKNRNVPYVTDTKFVNFLAQLNKYYHNFKSKGSGYFGVYILGRPMLIVNDLEIIKNIILKDFHHFNDHGNRFNEKHDPLTANLFNLSGPRWKKMRVKLTPTFTTGKMKMMIQNVVENGKQLTEYVEDVAERKDCLDIKYIIGNFLTDVIGSCAFGLQCNSFAPEENEFRKYGNNIFNTTPSKIFTEIMYFAFPNLSQKLGIHLLDKNLSEFFTGVIKETVEYRQKNNITRKDFLQLMIDMKNNKQLDKETEHELENNMVTMEEITAQAFVFFLAGFETSSTTLTFCFYELAKDQDLQNKIRNEIKDVLAKHNEEITYEAITEMKFMAQVIDETLRMYPPVPILPRKCSKDYKIPNTDTVIEKGTLVIIPTFQLHYDSEYYENPEEFNPERFTEENKKARNTYTYLPFGEGPRLCIGMRFGLMQVKVALTVLLSKYRFTLSPKTIEPLGLYSTSPHTGVLCSKNTVYLNVHKLAT